jgi:hypothetical protein
MASRRSAVQFEYYHERLRANIVDALVAAEAVASEADVLTGDAVDLRALLANHPRVRVIPL